MSDTAELPPPLTGWAGFEDPNYTNVPDSFFDVLLPLLTDVEIRVLLYIIRRTYGFKKPADTVSLSQITDGITTREGRRLDGGAGVSKGGAIRAIARLEARGILLVQRNRSAARGNEPTTYQLRKAGPPLYTGNTSLVHGVHQGGVPGEPALVHEIHTQETAVQETESQEDSNPSLPPKTRRTGRTPAAAGSNRGISLPATPAGGSPAQSPLADTPAAAGRYTGPHSAYLAGVIFDHSTELGDGVHKAANSTQAHRLWQASGLDEAAFVALLHEARQRVRTYQGKQGTGSITNKMGYYFRVLAALADVPTELGAGR
ncbi:MAG: replication protein [Chloroflexota bacterium]|nr:replication protein [Chloroflexota bacterium]